MIDPWRFFFNFTFTLLISAVLYSPRLPRVCGAPRSRLPPATRGPHPTHAEGTFLPHVAVFFFHSASTVKLGLSLIIECRPAWWGHDD
jgi:hypothetical protein